MLMVQLNLETVTFDGHNEGYDYPELSGYGSDVPVEILHHHTDKPLESITVRIGDNLFLPCQLEYLLKEIESYRKAIVAAGNPHE